MDWLGRRLPYPVLDLDDGLSSTLKEVYFIGQRIEP